MPGNKRVFVSHTHEDNELCVPLLAALDAWGVDYWFDTEQLNPGSQLSERIQQALNERDVFLRVCTPAAQQSFWMSRELDAAQGMRADARAHNQADRRKIICLILAPGYVAGPNEQADVIVDAVGSTRASTLKQLRLALGIPLPERRISRRALLGGSVAGAVVVVGGTGAAALYLTKDVKPASPPVLPTTRLPAPKPQPSASRLQWYFKTAGWSLLDNNIYGLTAAGDAVYVAASEGIYTLGAADGSLRWLQTAVMAESAGSPVVAGDTIYVGATRSSDTSTVLATLNTADGSVRWTQPVDDDINSTPTVSGAAVYALTGKSLYAFQAATGAPMWKQPLPKGDNFQESSPAVGNGVVYVGSGDKTFYAFDAQTGALRWRTPTGGSITSSPAVSNGLVYFGGGENDGAVYALSATDGSRRWRTLVSDGISSVDASPVVQNGIVYIGGGDTGSVSGKAIMYALDAATGAIRWQVAPVGSTSASIACRAAIAGDVLYVTVIRNVTDVTLYALSIQDGSTLWSYDAQSSLSPGSLSPTLGSGLVLFSGSADHAVYALRT